MSLPSNPSASFIARNPHIYGGVGKTDQSQNAPDSGSKNRATVKRIKQETVPKLNKLEREWLSQLKWEVDATIHAQAWRVRLANGAWFKVDFCAFYQGQWWAWEVKGPKQGKNVDRGLLALKVAAAQFPEVKWILVWKDDAGWHEQEVLP
jgi:predicted AlkP superfamily phosphohydrolase/phosphomutase